MSWALSFLPHTYIRLQSAFWSPWNFFLSPSAFFRARLQPGLLLVCTTTFISLRVLVASETADGGSRVSCTCGRCTRIDSLRGLCRLYLSMWLCVFFSFFPLVYAYRLSCVEASAAMSPFGRIPFSPSGVTAEHSFYICLHICRPDRRLYLSGPCFMYSLSPYAVGGGPLATRGAEIQGNHRVRLWHTHFFPSITHRDECSTLHSAEPDKPALLANSGLQGPCGG